MIGEIGSRLLSGLKFWLDGLKLNGAVPPPVFGSPNPWPTTAGFPTFVTPPPPHWIPIDSSAVRSRISIRASIFTCGRGTSKYSRTSFLIRSMSAR